MAAPIKFGVGQSVLRKEDDALIRGKGRYTDDHAPAAMMLALVLRSPHAHAKFTIDATHARSLPGVAAILTADAEAYQQSAQGTAAALVSKRLGSKEFTNTLLFAGVLALVALAALGVIVALILRRRRNERMRFIAQ